MTEPLTAEDMALTAVPFVGQVVTAVHERDAKEIARLIHGAHPAALEVALVVAAAMVDDTKSFTQLLAWADLPDNSIDPADWTDEQVEIAHRLYGEGDRARYVTLGQIIWRRRWEAA